MNLLATFGAGRRGDAAAAAALGVPASGAASFGAGFGASFLAARAVVAVLGVWSIMAHAFGAARGVGYAVFGAAASAAAHSRDAGANHALDPAPFARRTLRNKAAQRRPRHHASPRQIMLRPINAFAFLAIVLAPAVTLAESASVYLEQVSCEGGPFGLRLPPHLPEVMKLGSIASEEVQQIEKWDGYTTIRKYIAFRGFTLGLVTFSNDPNRYMVSFAEISTPRWSHIAPFRVGESVKSVRRKLGSSAASDPELKAKYGSEAGDVSFRHADGTITKVTYACYTG